MNTFKKFLIDVFRMLIFFWVIAIAAVGIGAARSNQLDVYFEKLGGVWDIVLVAALLTVVGGRIYQFIVKNFDLK